MPVRVKRANFVFDWLTWETLTYKLTTYIVQNNALFQANKKLAADIVDTKESLRTSRQMLLQRIKFFNEVNERLTGAERIIANMKDLVNKQADIIECNRAENSKLLSQLAQLRGENNVLYLERDRLMDKLERAKRE